MTTRPDAFDHDRVYECTMVLGQQLDTDPFDLPLAGLPEGAQEGGHRCTDSSVPDAAFSYKATEYMHRTGISISSA